MKEPSPSLEARLSGVWTPTVRVGKWAENRAGRLAFLGGAICVAGLVAATAAARANGGGGTPVIPPGQWLTAWWVGVIGSFLAYVLAVLALTRVSSGGRRLAIAFALLIQGIPLATPLFLSTDARSYADFGASSDPYASNGSVYGPLWTGLSRLFVHSGNADYAFRLLACVSVLAIALLASTLVARKALAIAFVGWNPMLAFHFSGSGHIDAFMTLLVVGALVLARAGRTQAAGAAWVTAFFVKWSAGPLFVLWAIGERRRGKGVGLAGAISAFVLIAVLSYWLFEWTWLHAFVNLREVERHQASFLYGWLRNLGISYRHEMSLSESASIVAFAAFAAQAWRSRLHLGLAAGTLTVLEPRIEPWYLVLSVGLAAADDDDRWGKVLAIALTGIMFTDVLTPAIA